MEGLDRAIEDALDTVVVFRGAGGSTTTLPVIVTHFSVSKLRQEYEAGSTRFLIEGVLSQPAKTEPEDKGLVKRLEDVSTTNLLTVLNQRLYEIDELTDVDR